MVFIYIYKKLLLFHRNIGDISLIPVTIDPNEEAGYPIFKQERHSQFLSPSHILERSSSELAEDAQAEAARSGGCSAPPGLPPCSQCAKGRGDGAAPKRGGAPGSVPPSRCIVCTRRAAAAPRHARAATLQAFPAEGCRAVPCKRGRARARPARPVPPRPVGSGGSSATPVPTRSRLPRAPASAAGRARLGAAVPCWTPPGRPHRRRTPTPRRRRWAAASGPHRGHPRGARALPRRRGAASAPASGPPLPSFPRVRAAAPPEPLPGAPQLAARRSADPGPAQGSPGARPVRRSGRGGGGRARQPGRGGMRRDRGGARAAGGRGRGVPVEVVGRWGPLKTPVRDFVEVWGWRLRMTGSLRDHCGLGHPLVSAHRGCWVKAVVSAKWWVLCWA